MSVLLISAPCHVFVTATASKFLFIFDLARLFRFSDPSKLSIPQKGRTQPIKNPKGTNAVGEES